MKQVASAIQKSWPFLLGLSLGLYFIVFNFIGCDFAYFPGDLGDARFNMYILEHAHKFFIGAIDSYWNAQFMFPEKNVITYSDNLLGSAPIYSLFRLFGYDVITAFQIWIITLITLNFTTCYLFFNSLFKNRYAAVLGAFIFAFSIVLQTQINHAQTFPRFFIPLCLWMLLLFYENFKPKYFLLSLLFLILQFYCGIYLGFMLLVPFLIFLFLTLIYKRKIFISHLKNRKWLLQMLLICILNILLLSALMIPYYFRSLTTGSNYYHSIIHSVPSLKSYFYTNPNSFIWHKLSNVARDYIAHFDHQLFPGIVVLLSIFFIIYLRIFRKTFFISFLSRKIIFFLIAGLMTFLIFIRFDNYSLYAFLKLVPGYGAMRSLTRIINIELLFFGAAVGLSFIFLFKKIEKWHSILFIFVLGFLLLDNYHVPGGNNKYSKKDAQTRINELQTKLKTVPENALFSYEPNDDYHMSFVYQIDAMLASQSLNLKTVNAYTGTSPQSYTNYWNLLDSTSRIEWFNANNFNPDTVYIIH